MNRSPDTDPWQRLAALARTAPSPADALVRDAAADARFAQRVVRRWAQASSQPPPSAASWALPWEAWGLRGLGAAGALAVLMLTWNLPLLSADTPPDDLLPPDSVAELAEAF